MAYVYILLCVIIVIWYYQCYQYLQGYWVADSVFLDYAGLSKMIICILPEKSYIIMIDKEGNTLLNQPFVVDKTLLTPWSVMWSALTMGTVRGCARITSVDGIIPERVNISFSQRTGVLTLYDKKVYACLRKDLEASEVAIKQMCS